MSDLISSSKIKILPELIINKIAAGEVVERPASVVKELIENSIDADSEQILVTVKNGGKDYISILDDGKGMSEADARLAVERHATSKIYTEEDLAKIHTLGFRGEALASIASVSNFELLTCEDEKKGAVRLSIKGGYLEHIGKAGFPKGTRITIQNLFFNTPARLKFMKSTQTEFQHIQNAVIHQALAYPHIQFRLTHNQQVLLNLARGQTLEERIYQLFGEEFQDGLISVEHEEAYLNYHGFISAPMSSKSTRRWQYLFVNNRYVKCPAINHGVYDAYRTLLMKNQHPVFFLKITVDPTEIDVNVHPAKTEIRFRNSQLVHTILADHLQKSLKEGTRRRFFVRDLGHNTLSTVQGQTEMPIGEKPVTQGQINQQQDFKNKKRKSFSAVPDKKTEFVPSNDDNQSSADASKSAEPNTATDVSKDVKPDSDFIQQTPANEKDTLQQHQKDGLYFQSLSDIHNLHVLANASTSCEHFFPLGQIDKTYIIAESKTGMVVIDQHAAHERILFEKYRIEFYSGGIQTETFLVPPLLELSPQNAILLEQYLPQFEKLGFDIEPFGGKTYAIRSIPAILTEQQCKASILEVLDELSLFGKSGRLEEVFNDVLEKVACHSAIRAGQQLSREEMNTLVSQLEQLDIHLFCPHGRPALVELSIKELEKRFKRVI